jgi:hypothetical protein
MWMRLRLGPIPLEIMFVLAMLVVPMPMSALEQLVRMGVLIAFAHLQPYTDAISPAAHQKSNDGISGHSKRESATPKRGSTEKYAPERNLATAPRSLDSSARYS